MLWREVMCVWREVMCVEGGNVGVEDTSHASMHTAYAELNHTTFPRDFKRIGQSAYIRHIITEY